MRVTTRRCLGRRLQSLGRVGLIFSLLTCTIAGDAPAMDAQNVPPIKVMLERGRVLVLKLDTTVSSESAHKGDHLELQLVRPLMSGGTMVLPAGWMVPAHITMVRRAGKSDCTDGEVVWKIDPVMAADGTKVSLVGFRAMPYGINGKLADMVRLESTGEKVRRGVERVVLQPVFAAAVIVFLPMAIVLGSDEVEPCRKRPGDDRHFPAGTILYAAVAKSVRITLNPPTTQ